MKRARPPTAMLAVVAIACVLANFKAAAVVLGPARTKGGDNHTKDAMITAALPVNLAIIADKCKCTFVGLCTCGAAVDFLDCVVDSVASGQCEDSSTDFATYCESMALTCPSAGLTCSQDKATCLHQEPPSYQTIADITQDLQKLQKRKCILQAAVEDGYANADKRLKEVYVQIQAHLDMLKAKGGRPFYMGCTPLPAGAEISWVGGEAVGLAAAPSAASAGEAAAALMVHKLDAAAPISAPITVPPVHSQGSVPPVRSQASADASSASTSGQPTPAASSNTASSPRFSYFIASLVNYGVYLVLVLLCAYFYDHVRLKTSFPQPTTPKETYTPKWIGHSGFAYGLFDCVSVWKLSALSFCCLPIRWADTMNKADFMSYWRGVAVMLTLVTFEHFTWGLSQFVASWLGIGVGVIGSALFVLCMVFYRQKLRTKYNMPSDDAVTYAEDCLSWMCCPCCAAVQEAREVEGACERTAESNA